MTKYGHILQLMIVVLACCMSRAEADSGKCSMTALAITHPFDSDHDVSMLRLENVAPAAGSPLYHDSVFAADLEYWIQDFEPGRYTIIPQFAESRERGTAGDYDLGSLLLTSPAGRVHLCFTVAYIWKEQVERPLEVYFLLNKYLPNKWLGDHWTSESVASTKHLLYPAAN